MALWRGQATIRTSLLLRSMECVGSRTTTYVRDTFRLRIILAHYDVGRSAAQSYRLWSDDVTVVTCGHDDVVLSPVLIFDFSLQTATVYHRFCLICMSETENNWYAYHNVLCVCYSDGRDNRRNKRTTWWHTYIELPLSLSVRYLPVE